MYTLVLKNISFLKKKRKETCIALSNSVASFNKMGKIFLL